MKEKVKAIAAEIEKLPVTGMIDAAHVSNILGEALHLLTTAIGEWEKSDKQVDRLLDIFEFARSQNEILRQRYDELFFDVVEVTDRPQ